MTKQEFLAQLRKGLSGLPKDDIEERLTFYSEIIDDRIEDGIEEETAIREIGDVESIVSQIISDIPLGKLVKEKVTPKRKMRAWEIVCLVVGSPVWLSLLIALLAVLLSVYIVLWAVIIVLWAVFATLAAGALAGLLVGVYFAVSSNVITGIALIGAGIVLAGLSIFMYFGAKSIGKSVLNLTKKIAIWIKNRFIRKEKVK